jgi:hypothetical protein
MPLRKLKYPLLILMLHVVVNSCNNRYEIARLSYSVSGCFFGFKSELTIYLQEGKPMATLRYKDGPSQTTPLDQSQLAFFTSFANELKKRKSGGICTIFERYRLVMNGRAYYLEDGHCSWDGYGQLEQKLFGSTASELIQP